MILRKQRFGNFTTISNDVIQDKKLSYKAKGVLLYLLSRPDNWEFYETDIANQSTDGKDAVRTALSELIREGFLVRKQAQDGNGRFAGWEYTVYDCRTKNGKPVIGKSKNGKSATTNTDITNTEVTKTEITKKEISLDVYSEAAVATKRLAQLVKENYGFLKLDDKTLKSWYADIEKLHRIDGYDWQTIQAVIEWSQQDEFWKQNIRSGSKLRKQFETLLVKAASQKNRVAVIS